MTHPPSYHRLVDSHRSPMTIHQWDYDCCYQASIPPMTCQSHIEVRAYYWVRRPHNRWQPSTYLLWGLCSCIQRYWIQNSFPWENIPPRPDAHWCWRSVFLHTWATICCCTWGTNILYKYIMILVKYWYYNISLKYTIYVPGVLRTCSICIEYSISQYRTQDINTILAPLLQYHHHHHPPIVTQSCQCMWRHTPCNHGSSCYLHHWNTFYHPHPPTR